MPWAHSQACPALQELPPNSCDFLSWRNPRLWQVTFHSIYSDQFPLSSTVPSPLSLFFLIFIRVDLQFSVNFCCTVKWPRYTYYSFSHIILCHVPSQVIRYSFLCYTQQNLIAYPLQILQFASTNPKLSVLSMPSPSLLATTSLFSKSMSLFLFCR